MRRPAVGRVCVQPVDKYLLLMSNPLIISLRWFIFFSPILGKFFVIFITRSGFDIFMICVLVLLYEENK